MDMKIIYPNERSPTPEIEEEFDQDEDWAYQIISEEVGYKGAIRHKVCQCLIPLMHIEQPIDLLKRMEIKKGWHKQHME